ncbi:MAG: DUF302 domain-containing protein [Anaerolineales bacterium]|nr:DUF302 domain-containing protein [Anaerolineales bacterium]
MSTTEMQLGFKVELNATLEEALEKVTAALKTEGFGVLTEIDVQATLKKKLEVDFRPYRILGACNPSLAHRALTVAPEVGLLLPCNVTVAQVGANRVEVALVDLLAMLGIVANPALQTSADEAHAKLSRVAAILKEEPHAIV